MHVCCSTLQVEALGGLDVVINNGGVGEVDPTDPLDPEAWHTMFQMHVVSAVAIIKVWGKHHLTQNRPVFR